MSAVYTMGLARTGLLSAMRAVNQLGSNLAVYSSVPSINLKDLCFYVLVGKSQMVTEKFPHCLTS